MSLSWGGANLSVSAIFKRSLQSSFSWFDKIQFRKITWDFDKSRQGKAYLVGAGPGDSELLTLKAVRLLQEADVVLYDWLVSEDILALIPSKTKCIFVGKRSGRHSMSQAEICALLCEQALAGQHVVRLKGGDPSIFGRLGEECAVLEQCGVPFAVVPGVTAASGMSAYTGVPLTDRRCSQSVRFITAQFKKAELEPDWTTMAPRRGYRSRETLVFYMGLSRVSLICQRLIEHGFPIDTPAMIVDQATTTEQTTFVRTLKDLPGAMQNHMFTGPALLVVGEVIGFQHQVDLTLLSQEAIHV